MRRSIRRWGWLGLLAVLPVASSVRADDGPAASPKAAPEPEPAPVLEPDVFAEALADAHLTVDELGFRPRGSWARYPQNPPFKMPFFDDLLAHPLDTYEFTRTLGNAVEDLLTPAKLTAAPEKDKPESLFSLAVNLATDRLIGGMRGFGFGLLDQEIDPKDPLGDAFRRLEAVRDTPDDDPIGAPVAHRKNSGSNTFDVGDLPSALHVPLARLLVELAAASRWIEVGLGRSARSAAVWRDLPKLVSSTPDASAYFPSVEAAARNVDPLSLAYGAMKALAAVQRARREIAAARPAGGWAIKAPWNQETRLGWIRVCGDVADSPPDQAFDPPLLLLTLGHPRVVEGSIGANVQLRSLSVALLMDDPEDGREMLVKGSIARGVLGCGIVYSAGKTNTTYEADSWGLGAGLLGVGILVDEGGDDVYRIREVGEGAGYFGAGLLLDAAGNDRYELLSGDGQGYGGPGGVGVLADRSGDDVYYAEPLPAKAGQDRADYHSDQKIVGSNAQGAGMGRRGDISDGHAWAGGLGALLDIDGNDKYSAGNFSQGVGYWFGTGLLYDGGGDDTYDSVYFSHGSGAHFAIGAVVDEGGDDVHRLSDFPKAGIAPKAWPGAGIAFGWDVVNAFVFDRAGNDRYEASIISEGVSDIRSFALLLDEGGDDVYVAQTGAAAFGAVDEQPTYLTPHRTTPFAYHLPQAAMLLDLGGHDRYLRVPAGGGEAVADETAGDDRTWSREPKVGPRAGRNVVVARDVAHGRAGFLDAWPRRVAPKPTVPPPPPDVRPPAPPVVEPAPAPAPAPKEK